LIRHHRNRGVALILLTACLAASQADGSAPRRLHEAGTVAAVYTEAVSVPPVWGDSRVLRLLPEGSLVTAGDTLAVLGNDRFVDALREVEADFEVQQRVLESVAAQRASHELASHNAITKARLGKEAADLAETNQQFAAALDREQAALGRRQAEVSLELARHDSVAQAGLDSLALASARIRSDRLRARRNRYQAYLDMLVLVAPASGMVVYHRERTEDGVDVVRLGDTVSWNQHLLDITDVSTLQVEMEVHERDRGLVRVGQRVTVVPEAYPDREYRGRVTALQSLPLAAEAGAVSRRFLVTALLDGVVDDLMPGMSVRATIDVEDPDATR
jgi:HlyD family secretion protein